MSAGVWRRAAEIACMGGDLGRLWLWALACEIMSDVVLIYLEHSGSLLPRALLSAPAVPTGRWWPKIFVCAPPHAVPPHSRGAFRTREAGSVPEI